MANGGLLPAWKVQDLPAPPPFGFRNAILMIGPGAIALSMAIGTGEWILGPLAVVKYGYSLLWMVTLSILFQLVLNLTFLRYTLYTGEPVVSGFMRTAPGPVFWSIVYIVFALLHVGWPYTAALTGQVIFGAIFGHLPEPPDRGTVLMLGYLTFFAAILIVAFGGKIERTLEWVNWFMVIFIVGFLLVVDILFVPWRLWWEGLIGFVGIGGDGRFGLFPRGADWVLLGSLASFAAVGGIGNLWTTNWVRDKGYGMGSVVGYIPSLVGGKMVKVSPTGSVFPITADNLSRWRQWWKYVWTDQGLVWAVGCFIGMYLNVILAKAIFPPDANFPVLQAGAYQANFLASHGGKILYFLTLLNGFWIFFGSQLGVLDGFCRLSTDILWSGSARVRAWARDDIRRVYYALLLFFAVWGCVAIRLAAPYHLVQIAANVAGFILVVAGIHGLLLNRKFLPRELQGPLWERALTGLAVVFYALFFVASVGRLLNFW